MKAQLINKQPSLDEIRIALEKQIPMVSIMRTL